MTGAVVRATTATWRRFPSGAVVLPAGAPDVLRLNRQGAEIWDLLASPLDEAALTEQLAARYGLEADAIASDVRAAVADLVAAGALEVEPR